MSQKDFLRYLAPTNPFPFQLEVDYAEGSHIYTTDGRKYIDMISGVAVNNWGHKHPHIIKAIHEQVDKYLHVMVYGEFIQKEPLKMAQLLADLLPPNLNMVYPVNSGTEANEAAIKLAKRATGRQKIIAFNGAYHGSTNGSLSLSSNETKKQKFRPLLEGIHHIDLNSIDQLDHIDEETAGVILETVQGDAGVRTPEAEYLKALRQRCDEVGSLLIFDEIQCGMGRTGLPFAFQHFDVVPDVLTLGKALGGGLPIGALVSNAELLKTLSVDPMLGHITTFGGNAVVAAAARATLELLKDTDWDEVERKAARLEQWLKVPGVIALRRIGMMFAVDLSDETVVNRLVERALERGFITFWFLSHPYSFRLSPPLNITWEDLEAAGETLHDILCEVLADKEG